MGGAASEADLIRVVLADANVLYSRVLRDYLLYAADREIVVIAWSSRILDEVTEHLMANVEGFDHVAAQRLVSAMNRAFPYAEVEPDQEHWHMLEEVSLPDEDDRHVLAASLAAEATVLCTANTKDFPNEVVEALGVEMLTPDQLLSRLVVEYEPQMLAGPPNGSCIAQGRHRRVDRRGAAKSWRLDDRQSDRRAARSYIS